MTLVPSSPPIVHLHVGPMRTGTTYLQRTLEHNREWLGEQGVLFPGADGWADQARAVRDLLGYHDDERMAASARGAWRDLAAEVRAHEGPAVVISMEYLCFASPAKIAEVVRSLRPCDVRVVMTVRDAGAVIPSQWQAYMQNRGTTPWSEFSEQLHSAGSLRQVRTPFGRVNRALSRIDGIRPTRRTPAFYEFSRSGDVGTIVDRWCGAVGPDKLTVVVVPPEGSPQDLLWSRFATAAGLSPTGAETAPPTPSTSLGAVSAELMRRLNERFCDLPVESYRAVLAGHLGQRVLADRRAAEPAPQLTRRLAEFAADANWSAARAIAGSHARVVGRTDELPLSAAKIAHGRSLPDRPAAPDDAQVLAAAADGAAGLRALRATYVEALGDSGAAAGPGPAVRDPEQWGRTLDPQAAAVADLGDLVQDTVDVRTLLHGRPGVSGLV